MRTSIMVIGLMFMFIAGCASNDMEDKIKKAIGTCRGSDNCIVIISSLTDFKWDKLYVFNTATAPDVIDSAIGMDYPYYEEFSRTMIFLNKGKIVHHESHSDEIETATDGAVIFDYPDSLNHQVYIINHDKFSTQIIRFKAGEYYLLKQVK